MKKRAHIRRCLIAVTATLLLAQAAPQPNAPAPAGSSKAPAPAAAAPAPLAGIASGAVVAIIPVKGVIHDFTFQSLRRRTEAAIADGATWIVYEFDTNGGEITAAMDISKYIKALPRPTLAWVHPKAYSMGILMAAACDELAMSSSSAAGDCAPIVPGKNLAPHERAKALSPLLAEFRDSARANDYDPAVFHAMCVLGVELYLIEHQDTGEKHVVNEADYAVMVRGREPGPGMLQQATQQILGALPLPSDPDEVAKVRLELASESERGQWQLVRQVHDGQTLYTVHQDEAYEIGLSVNDPKTQTLNRDTDIAAFLRASSITRIGQHWVVNIAYVLCHPIMRAVLLVVLVIAAGIELSAPGLGVPGIVALITLVLLVGAPFLIGIAEVWHLILFFVGVLLILAEVFVVPGFGIAGISGIICLFIGLVLMVVPTTGGGVMPMPGPGTAGILRESVIWSVIGVIAAGVSFAVLMYYFGTVPGLNRLVLQSPATRRAEDPRPVGNARHVAEPLRSDVAVASGIVRIGDEGVAITELRPSGRAEFAGTLVDVVTPGNWIEPRTAVRVIEIAGNRIVVDREGAA